MFIKIFSGVMTNFKGLLYFFQPDKSFERIGYNIQIKNETLEFVPLNTKLPFKYCSLLNVKTTENQCWEYDEELFNKRQLYSFKSYLSIYSSLPNNHGLLNKHGG